MMLISSAKTDDYNFGRTHGKPANSSQIFLTKPHLQMYGNRILYIVMEKEVEKKHASEGERSHNMSRFPRRVRR